nr:uncharacterized protein At4g15545 [Ipomoea batatas]
MSQSSIESSRTVATGADFLLSDEVLSVIPTDPYEQLDLARKITSMAIASRVTKLESEVGRLREMLHHKDRAIVELEDKVSNLEQAYQETELRLKITREDNVCSISFPKAPPFLLLETFKRQLMQSLNDDNSTQSETVDIGTYDQSVAKPYHAKDEAVNCYITQHPYNGSKESIGVTDDGSPHRTSGTTSPTKFQYEGRGSMSSFFPSSQQSSAANSPPRVRPPTSAQTPRIDGKEFFRHARSRLSYEQFSAFLANVKEFNSHRQSREDTLRKAEEIFGKDNKDLYLLFQGLLNRSAR